MSHKHKSQKRLYLGVTLGVTLAVLTVSVASITSLQGSVTPGYNCSKQPTYRGSPWQNRKNTLDVNADGVVTQADAEAVIASLNTGGETRLLKLRPMLKSKPYIDVDGDMKKAPIDALHIVNYLRNCVESNEGGSTGTGGNDVRDGGYSIDNGSAGATGGSGEVSQSSNPWHNRQMPADVNGDGFISPVDVLAVINEINNVGSHALDQSVSSQPLKIDTNNDGSVSPIDVMIVNNALNNQ